MKDKHPTEPNRRQFLQKSALLGAGLAMSAGFPAIRAGGSPNEKMVIAVMGLGRGQGLINSAIRIPNVELAYVCDIDEQRIARSIASVADKQPRPPKGVKDFREILENPHVDTLFIATTNHWHAPATILACSAGKHVYVEKPASHNPREGEMMVASARKHERVVQMGNQRRSWPAVIEAIEKLHAGVIGPIRYARCWYNNARGSIGRGQPAPVPEHLDYSLWQGPAPERPYKTNLIHYNWHWHWHWGNGELGNNGVHALDIARWGLGVDYPKLVGYTGGRYHYADDQETPDTGVATYDFGDKGASWEHSSSHPRRHESHSFVTFYGDNGSVAVGGGANYKIFDIAGKEVESGSSPGGDQVHIDNFLECIRSGARPNSEIEDAQISTLICHLGNIAYRTGRTLHFDPAQRTIINDPEAMSFWRREYRPGWEPKV